MSCRIFFLLYMQFCKPSEIRCLEICKYVRLYRNQVYDWIKKSLLCSVAQGKYTAHFFLHLMMNRSRALYPHETNADLREDSTPYHNIYPRVNKPQLNASLKLTFRPSPTYKYSCTIKHQQLCRFVRKHNIPTFMVSVPRNCTVKPTGFAKLKKTRFS